MDADFCSRICRMCLKIGNWWPRVVSLRKNFCSLRKNIHGGQQKILPRAGTGLRQELNLLYLKFLSDTFHGFDAVVAFAESGKPQIAFSVRTKPCTGSSDYVNAIEQLVEKFPRTDAVGSFKP